MWIVQRGRANRRGNLGCERIVEIDDDQRFVRQDVRIGAGDDDAARSSEDAAGVERQRTLQEIVRGIAVKQSTDAGTLGLEVRVADDDQPLFLVSNVQEAIEQMNWLLFVFGKLDTQWIDGECAGRGYGLRVLRRHVEALPQRRKGRSRHLF